MMTIQDIANSLYADKPEKTLYHYTSFTGLLGIIKSQSLWASDIRFLNDAAEMKHTADLLRDEIARRLEEGKSNSKLLSQFRDWLFHRITDGHMLFVVSLTANGNLLSQWRGYCPLGKGISVGFNSRVISDCAARQSFIIGKCIYDSARQSELTKSILDEIEKLAVARGENKDASKRHPSQSYHDVFEEVEADLLRVAAILKHTSFKEEEEWRAVSPVLTNYVNSPIYYREGMSMLVPYLEFSLILNNANRMEIQHIYLGPTPNNNLSMTSLSRYLSKSGVSPKDGVTACQIPFRQW